MGGQQRRFGSFLHGFSHKALATAWGVDEDTIGSLLESQSEVGIVRVRSPIRFPETTSSRSAQYSYSSSRRSLRRWHNEEEALFDSITNNDDDASLNIFWELQYTPSSQPDIFVENGGFMSIITSHKLPALHNVGFSVGRVSLKEVRMIG